VVLKRVGSGGKQGGKRSEKQEDTVGGGWRRKKVLNFFGGENHFCICHLGGITKEEELAKGV